MSALITTERLQPRPRLRSGTRLGKYRLVERLARTDISQVWRARDELQAQWVALKIPNTLKGSQDEKLLLEEIRISARLVHPNILSIKNAECIQGYYCIATSLAKESLEQRLQHRISTHRALDYFGQMLCGLSYAHEQRCLHRDLKPGNLLIFKNHRLRISDFGLAKLMRHSMMSATGSGTLLYLAPEQAHGYPCFASDVFSAGLIGYELLTREQLRWPFEWSASGERTLRRKVPEGVVDLLRKATHFSHKQRFPNAIEMFDAYQQIIEPYEISRQSRNGTIGIWKKVRHEECLQRFGQLLWMRHECPDCGGPLSEHMRACPWCGLTKFGVGEQSEYSHYCTRCRRGLRDEWCYCPWCWGPRIEGAGGQVLPSQHYRFRCHACRKPTTEGMRYCPWCHARASYRIRLDGLPDRCESCKGSVVQELWEYCPWCAERLA